jgi:hypothetical protein
LFWGGPPGPDRGYTGCVSQRVLLDGTKAALRHA